MHANHRGTLAIEECEQATHDVRGQSVRRKNVIQFTLAFSLLEIQLTQRLLTKSLGFFEPDIGDSDLIVGKSIPNASNRLKPVGIGTNLLSY